MYHIILAEHPREASAYAVKAKLPRGLWRYAVKASSIHGLKVAVIHELPGFARRRDRHAINAELRYSRGERIVVPEDVEDLSITHEVPQAELDRFDDEGGAQIWPIDAPMEVRLATGPDPQWHTDMVERLLPSDPSETRQRRSRCKVCGNLVWNDEDPEHDATAHAEAAPVAPTSVASFFS